MDQLVQFLTGHERAVFTNGRFAFDLRLHPAALLALALLLLAFAYFVYAGPRARRGGRSWVALISLRSALLLLQTFLLLKPVIVVPSVIPRSNSVALLADNSRNKAICRSLRTRSVSSLFAQIMPPTLPSSSGIGLYEKV